jgi:hypothetical protein
MITACFARALQSSTSRICVYFLLTFQEIRPISKTRNQLLLNRQNFAIALGEPTLS